MPQRAAQLNDRDQRKQYAIQRPHLSRGDRVPDSFAKAGKASCLVSPRCAETGADARGAKEPEKILSSRKIGSSGGGGVAPQRMYIASLHTTRHA